MAKPGVLDLVRLLFNPNVSKMMILQVAYGQLKIIGLAKILSAVLGLVIVGVSSVIKIPQIKKIINPELLSARIQVAQGLSLEGLSLETLGNWIHVAYNSQNNNPFRNYGESLFIGVQNIAIILLIEYYNARSKLASASGNDDTKIQQSLQQLVRPAATIAAAIIFLTKVAPEPVILTLQMASIPISILSKIPQIRQNQRLQRASHLSEVTVGANWLGSLIRVFTTVQDFDKLGRDKVLLAGYGLSFVLNLVLAGQVWYYGKQEKDKTA